MSQKTKFLMTSPELPIVTDRPFTVEGNIGSGKTTFLEYFSKLHDEVEIVIETVEKWMNVNGHNLMQMMFEDPEKWSSPFQTYVLLTIIQYHTMNRVKNYAIRFRRRNLHAVWFLIYLRN